MPSGSTKWEQLEDVFNPICKLLAKYAIGFLHPLSNKVMQQNQYGWTYMMGRVNTVTTKISSTVKIAKN